MRPASNTLAFDRDMVERLGRWYGPLLAGLYAASIAVPRFYRLSRGNHAAHIEALEQRDEAPAQGVKAK